MTGKPVSVRPSEAAAGGGLLDDVDVTFTNSHYAIRDKMNPRNEQSSGEGWVYIATTLVDDESTEHPEYYRLADPAKLVPSRDGKQLLEVIEGARPVKSAKGMLLLASMVNSGYPEDRIQFDIGATLDGVKARVRRRALPKIAGQEKDATILEVVKIHRYPWDAQPSTSAAKGTTKAATTATPRTPVAAPSAGGGNGAAPGDEIAARAGEVVGQVLAAKGSVPRNKISQEVFRLTTTDKNRNEIVKLAFDVKFLESLVGTPVQVGEDLKSIQFDGSTISLG